jgi:hypothetical protein
MKIVLACPDGQWVEGRAKAAAAQERLGALGFTFTKVNRGGGVFVQAGPQVTIELETLEGFWELLRQINGPCSFRDGVVVIEDLSVAD